MDEDAASTVGPMLWMLLGAILSTVLLGFTIAVVAAIIMAQWAGESRPQLNPQPFIAATPASPGAIAAPGIQNPWARYSAMRRSGPWEFDTFGGNLVVQNSALDSGLLNLGCGSGAIIAFFLPVYSAGHYEYSIDDGPFAQRPIATIRDGVIPIFDPKPFIEELGQGSRLRIRVGEHVHTFDITEGDEPMGLLRKMCF